MYVRENFLYSISHRMAIHLPFVTDFHTLCVGLSSKAIVPPSRGHPSGQRGPGSLSVCVLLGPRDKSHLWLQGTWLLERQVCVRLGVGNCPIYSRAHRRRNVSSVSFNRLCDKRKINSTYIFLCQNRKAGGKSEFVHTLCPRDKA